MSWEKPTEEDLLWQGWRWVKREGGLNHVPALFDSGHIYIDGVKYYTLDGFLLGPRIEEPDGRD